MQCDIIDSVNELIEDEELMNEVEEFLEEYTD
jgi:hypothetical protein